MTSDEIVRGLTKLRNESRTEQRASVLDAAIDRIEADQRELEKSDRRTAEQEYVIAAVRSTLNRGEHSKALAMLAWFASRGAPSGRFEGDPNDCRKQNEAREAFEAWWGGR